MRLPSSSLKIGVNADPRLDWSFERIARIDRVKDRKEETRFHTPQLTPGEKTFSVLVSRERRGAPGEPAIKTSERRVQLAGQHWCRPGSSTRKSKNALNGCPRTTTSVDDPNLLNQ